MRAEQGREIPLRKLYDDNSILILFDVRRRDGLEAFCRLVVSGLRTRLPERLADGLFAVAVLPGVSRRVKK